MTNRIAIGVIIINYNSASYLQRCLAALEKQSRPADEIIVYDNNSTIPLQEPVYSGKLDFKLIRATENSGFAGGNNAAIRELSAHINWIALLNPDAYADENWLLEMEKAIHDHPDYAFFGSKLLCADEPSLLDGTGDAYHISGRAWRINHAKPDADVLDKAQEIFSPCAAAALYRRDIFNAVQGFDERYFCYYEDTDLSFRLRLLGYRCFYIPTALVHHTGSATTQRYSEFCTYHGHRNLVWTYVKNMPFMLFLLFLPYHLLLNFFSLLRLSFRGQTKAIFRSKKDALKGLKSILADRRIIQKNRLVSSFNIFKALKKGMPW